MSAFYVRFSGPVAALLLMAMVLMAMASFPLEAQSGSPAYPMTGKEVPQLLPYEQAVRRVLEKWQVPGAAVAIAEGNRLIYARGIGWADREAQEPVEPTSRFRLASISKTFTGMAILKLAEEGKLNLDRPFISYLLPDLQPTSVPPPDARMANVTVRQLLLHTGGFDRPIEDDHVLYYNTASRLFGGAAITNDLMARYVMSQRLDFQPGTRFAYGNSGYQLLGRVIEKVTGKKYPEAIQDVVLRRAGATSVELGGNLLSQRLPGEVRYYDYPGAPLSTTAVAPGVTLPAPRPYNRRVDLSDSYGGMVGNSIDMLRFLLSIEGRRGEPLLNSTSLAAMTARPAPPVWPATGNYAGLTWRIIPIANGMHWWHSGGANGTRNLLVRRQNGRSWVVLTNTRPEDEDTIIEELFAAMAAAEAQVREWPTHDLFADYAGPTLHTSAETLSFSHQQGAQPPAAQRLQVTSNLYPVQITAETPRESWLKLDRVTGAGPFTTNVSVEPQGLAPGEYMATLRLTAPNAMNGPRLVRVVLKVEAVPVISAIRNSASLQRARSAAPESRLVLEAAEIATNESTEGLSLRLTDSAGAEHSAGLLKANATTVEWVVPKEAALGEAAIQLTTSRNVVYREKLLLTAASPGLYTANGEGTGAPLGQWIRVAEDGTETREAAAACPDGPRSCSPVPAAFGPETEKLELLLLSTGLRQPGDPAAYAVKAGDEPLEVLSVVAVEGEAGLDWLRVRLPRGLAGRGELDLTVTVAEATSNAVKIVLP